MTPTNLIAENQTVSRGVYGMAIRNALPVPEAFIATHADRIDRAYAFGEPVAMIVDELRLRWEHRPQRAFTISPRAAAVRVVRVEG